MDINSGYKLIKIADKSPGGWKTVDEYVSGSCNSEDKKNKSAEARALKIQRICTNTDRVFSGSAERFRNAQEIAELQVQEGPRIHNILQSTTAI